MDISYVLSCSVGECAYNQKMECHAPSITVGSDHSCCDIFTTQTTVKPGKKARADIDECKVGMCMFNKEKKCTAPGGIAVGGHMNHADCVTYVSKY